MAQEPSPQCPRQHFGAINPTAIPKLSLYEPSEQFRIVLSELINLSPRSHQGMRVALGSWMKQVLTSLDCDLVEDPPTTSTDEASAARSYWRKWYQEPANRQRILERRRQRYRERHLPPSSPGSQTDG